MCIYSESISFYNWILEKKWVYKLKQVWASLAKNHKYLLEKIAEERFVVSVLHR